VAAAKMMVLVNYRPEYSHPWGRSGYVTELRLDPLGEESAGAMLDTMLGEQPELASLKQLILAKSEGTPFFIEEIVQSLFDRGILRRNGGVALTKPVSEIRIPTSVEGVLAARIDRLAPVEKELLQTAAVVGREFSMALLEKLTNEPETHLQPLLAGLQAAEFIYERPAPDGAEYFFKHALTQDVAYRSLLLERRR